MVGGHSCVRLHLLLVVTRLIVIVECFCYWGHPGTDLVYIIITGHMDVSDGPFNKPLFWGKRNIRFTPTKSSNMIFMAHSCGLGGKYQYKHAKGFQIGHLKRLLQCCFDFFPFGWRRQTCLWHSEVKVIFIQDIFLISLICILVSV